MATIPPIVLPLLSVLAMAGCGSQSPETEKTLNPQSSEPSHIGAATEDGTSIDKTVLLMRYELLFADSSGSVEIWIDGNFLAIEETWKRSDAVPSLRWGTTKTRLLFDHKNEMLIVVNMEDNSYSRITKERIAGENEMSANRRPSGVGMDEGSPAVDDEAPTSKPTLVKTPDQSHPAGCTAFARDLPHGLTEETCFKTWERMGLDVPDLRTLLSLYEMVRELRNPPSELKVVINIAEAFSRNVGLLVSRREFGNSPFEEGNAVGLQPWDVVVTLKAAERIDPGEETFSIPEKAEEKFTLLPWKKQSLF